MPYRKSFLLYLFDELLDYIDPMIFLLLSVTLVCSVAIVAQNAQDQVVHLDIIDEYHLLEVKSSECELTRDGLFKITVLHDYKVIDVFHSRYGVNFKEGESYSLKYFPACLHQEKISLLIEYQILNDPPQRSRPKLKMISPDDFKRVQLE